MFFFFSRAVNYGMLGALIANDFLHLLLPDSMLPCYVAICMCVCVWIFTAGLCHDNTCLFSSPVSVRECRAREQVCVVTLSHSTEGNLFSLSIPATGSVGTVFSSSGGTIGKYLNFTGVSSVVKTAASFN